MRGRLAGAALGAALLIPLFTSAQAPAVPSPVVPIGSGLTAPTGVVETPDGNLWVTDETYGVCRIRPGERFAPALDQWCNEDHAGPNKASSVAFDPQTNIFYVADEASSGGAVWRLQWDAGSGRIEGGTPIVRLPNDRVTAVGLLPSENEGAPPDVVYATKGSAALMRVDYAIEQAQAPYAIGFAPDSDSLGLTHLDGGLYIADGNAISRLDLTAGGPAVIVPGTRNTGASAVTADRDRHRLYVGTSNGTLDDEVLVVDANLGSIERYERGFAAVGSMVVDHAGDLLVADDPAEAADVMDPSGQGRLWRVALQPLARPIVRIDNGPPAATRETAVTFTYTSRALTGFECKLDTAAWSTCAGTGSGTIDYTDLPDGVHRFEVRALDVDPAVGSGVPATRTFVVDTRAPKIHVSSDHGVEIKGTRLPLDLVADEPNVTFQCALDDRPAWDCDSSTVLTGLEPGYHKVRATGTDAAGNESDPDHQYATLRFHVLDPNARPPAPIVVDPEPVVEPPADTGGVAGFIASNDLRPFVLRPVRIDRPAPGGRARALRLVVNAPAGARRALVSLSRHPNARPIATRVLRLRPGATNRLRVQLTRKESARLRPGRYLVSVAVGPSTSRLGKAQTHSLRVRPGCRPSACAFAQRKAGHSRLVRNPLADDAS